VLLLFLLLALAVAGMDRKGNAEAGERIHREQEAHVSYAIGSGAASAPG
jgi:hypothetical protein